MGVPQASFGQRPLSMGLTAKNSLLILAWMSYPREGKDTNREPAVHRCKCCCEYVRSCAAQPLEMGRSHSKRVSCCQLSLCEELPASGLLSVSCQLHLSITTYIQNMLTKSHVSSISIAIQSPCQMQSSKLALAWTLAVLINMYQSA